MSAERCIRKAAPDDADAIWSIFHAVVAEGDSYSFDPATNRQEALAYWMASDKLCYVAEQSGKILGTCIIKPNQIGLGDHVANASFMVSPDARGQSIGETMGRYVLSEAKALGYRSMQFNLVISTNEPAVNLWKKLGFEVIGTIPEAFRHQKLSRLVDACIMYRKL